MTTRPPAGGFQTCRRCGADLADGAAFCAECGAPAYASTHSPTREPRGPRASRPWWVPAAIIVGGIAAIAGGALLAVALGDGDELGADPSAGANGSLPASVSASAASAAPSVEPTPSPSPTPAQAPVIANRSIVEVGDEALNLRQQPSEASAALAELPPGRRLFTIGEPTDIGELRWYRVGVVQSVTCQENCNLIGHIATPLAAAEEPWIAEVAIDCPSSPLTAQALAALAPLEALHCYGRNELVISGTVDAECCADPGSIAFTPAWLASPYPPAHLRPEVLTTLVVGFRPHPDAELEAPEAGDVVRVTGHFEDPAATSCRAAVEEDSPEPAEPPNPARLVLDCRATFVWTDYEVTGP